MDPKRSHHTAIDVADWFLRNAGLCSGEPITHLKLQKLVYYAQAWLLALNDRQLFEEDMEAWAHGPVAPSAYRAFAGSGWDPLSPPELRVPAKFADDELDILQEVMEVYGAYSAKKLEHMTHIESPWKRARGNLPLEARSEAIIEKEDMRSYFRELLERVEERKD